FVIGEGNQRQLLEDKIRKNKLEDIFILLGAKSNPYPYFKACDIYIQPSRFEGFGITIAEAKMFNKPIVATNFDAVRLQITNNINGLIVDLTPESIAYGIQKMINDNGYRNNIIENLKQEDVNNYEELDKFYEIIEESK
ncbi:glycosyltransferase, partial [Thomasclavelia cocleata]